MKELTELRSKLIIAEYEYRVAQGSLDSSPLEVVVTREALKQARFAYNEKCKEHIEDLYFAEDGA